MTTNTREIKFRAWDGDKKEMLTFSVPWYCDEYNSLCFEVEQEPRKEYLGALGMEGASGAEIMQYTGLKDKNGKEIYEGDLLLVLDEEVVSVTDEGYGPIESCNHIASVVFLNGAFCINIPDTDSGMTGLYSFRQWNEEVSDEEHEVIGNIYENSDLLV